MSIIIAGTIDFEPDQAERVVAEGRQYIEASLKEEGCIYYAWTLDRMVPGRVYVFEEWASQSALEGHFRDESYLKMRDHLGTFSPRAVSVKKYRFVESEPVYDETGTPRADFFTGGKI